MKNILFIAFVLTALTSFANELNPTKLSKSVTTVTFNNVKKGQQLSIKDLEDNILYKENIASNGIYTQYFDLTSLENGSYTIVLDQEVQIITKHFQVLDQVVHFNSHTEQVFYKPVAALRGTQILVSQLASTDEALDVSIYYNNDLVQEETLSDATVLSRIYQLSPDKRGEYVVIMKSDSKTFYKTFTL